VYDFRGAAAPLRIGVVNKTSRPIWIDWNRSVLKYGSQIVLLSNNETAKEANEEVKNESRAPSAPEMIMPLNSSNRICGTVTDGDFVKRKKYTFTRELIQVGTNTRTLKRATIDEEHSPIVFDVVLSVRPFQNDSVVVVEHHFYISEIVATTIAPQKLPAHLQRRSAILQSTTLTGTGIAIITTVATIAATIGVLYLKSKLDEEDE
jgi:hypothetical protein